LRDLQSGVVSLLEMLSIGAANLYLLGQQLRDYCVIPQDLASREGREKFQLFLNVLSDYCDDMGLSLSRNQIELIVNTVNSGGKIWLRSRPHLLQLQSRIFEELRDQTLFYVATNKTSYLDPQWLAATSIQVNFPKALKELRKAGRCYAYDESDACAFHSMRALELGLNSLATKLGVQFEHTNWHNVIEQIESVIEQQKKRAKPLRDLSEEKFLAQSATQFMYLKDGWRNYVMHVYETYSETEAREMLKHSRDFLSILGTKLAESGHPFTAWKV
jgi:HEPN domain-containing protein